MADELEDISEGSRFRGCLLGLACGDAVGTTVEGRERGSFRAVTDMVGRGPFKLEPGQWTDDTSMALCLGKSLLQAKGFNAKHQMEFYRRWAKTGFLSSTGKCFDIGNTVSVAIEAFTETGEPYSGPTDPQTAGNACVVRLAPVPLYFYPDFDETMSMAADSSRTTHGTEECLDACRLLAGILHRAVSGQSKEDLLFGQDPKTLTTDSIKKIAKGGYKKKKDEEIKGSGYVVESLEAGLYCFLKTESFEEAILMAANLGDDADSTSAICGQVAGAFYGEDGIPARWQLRLCMREEITELAERMHLVSKKRRREAGAG